MDPDEYIREYGLEGLESLTPMDATTYRMKQEMQGHDLSTQDGRTAYAMACAKHLAKVKEPVELENHVRALMLSTGFSREVLLAQIGRSELIEKEKRPAYSHVARPLEENSDGVDTQTAAAEKQLLLLLAERRIEPGTVTADDFSFLDRRRCFRGFLVAALAIVDGRLDGFFCRGVLFVPLSGWLGRGQIGLKRREDLGRGQNVAGAYAEFSGAPLRLAGSLFSTLIACTVRDFRRVCPRVLFLVLLGFVHVICYRISFRFSRIFKRTRPSGDIRARQ